jgi:hypothetical protein
MIVLGKTDHNGIRCSYDERIEVVLPRPVGGGPHSLRKENNTRDCEETSGDEDDK